MKVFLFSLLYIILSLLQPIQSYISFKHPLNTYFNADNKLISSSSSLLCMSSKDYFNRPGPWDDRDLHSLLDANKAWSAKMKSQNPDFFNDFKLGHAPKILWIGCSDARVPANEIIGEPAGSVFVHRNVANMVVNTDFNCMSVIQYAVDVLKVKHIIVCGHYDCGGIRAALEPMDHKSPLENWLRNIRDTYRLHKDELNAIIDSRERQRRLVELNVIEQCLNIYKTAVVQRSRAESYADIGKPGSLHTFAEPRVHAFVYEPSTGSCQKLPVKIREYIKDLRNVYDLYEIKKMPIPCDDTSNDECFLDFEETLTVKDTGGTETIMSVKDIGSTETLMSVKDTGSTETLYVKDISTTTAVAEATENLTENVVKKMKKPSIFTKIRSIFTNN